MKASKKDVKANRQKASFFLISEGKKLKVLF